MASEWTCLCYYEPHNQSMKSKVESKESIYQKNVRPLSSDDDDDEEEEQDKTVEDVFRAWLVNNPSVPSNAVDKLLT